MPILLILLIPRARLLLGVENDPYLNRFTQPDTIVPDPYNPQTLDRYSYALNNPIRYNDPTGHYNCTDAYDCGSDISVQSKIYAISITNDYKWKLKGKWTLKELETIYQTGSDILAYINKLTGGNNGLIWMYRNMGGTTIEHAGTFTLAGILGQAGRNTSWPWHTIYLKDGFEKWDVAHELAEIWDLHSGKFRWGGYHGGVADQLNAAFGGGLSNNPNACRFCNVALPDGSYGIDPNNPQNHLWARGSYANSSTVDYFSEAFSHMIYPHQNPLQIPAGVQSWMENYIQYSLLLTP